MTWNMDEFYKLLEVTGNDDEYLQALHSKIIKAKWLGEQALNKWSEIIIRQVGIPSAEFDEIEFEVETYIEASMQFMHSTADILAQIINATVLNQELAEGSVSASKVKGKLMNIEGATNLFKSLDNLMQSESFEYINGFVNTIKHRKLIEGIPSGEFGQDTQNKFGLMFKSFTYDTRNFTKEFKEVYADEVIEVYYQELEQNINKVGSEINDFLRRKQG